MLDIKRIREKTAEVYEGLRRRGADPALLDQVLELDKLRRASVTQVEELKNRRNARSKEIGAARKRGDFGFCPGQESPAIEVSAKAGAVFFQNLRSIISWVGGEGH